MINIFVCEDEPRYLKKISECIQSYILMNNCDLELTLATSDPADIIKIIKKHQLTGLYFLDIELEGGYNGVELGRTIRQYDPRGFIVFITSYPQYLSLTFEYHVEALSYIQKVSDDITVFQKIHECIENANKKHLSRPDDGRHIFRIQNGTHISVYYDDILFFETDPSDSRRVILHSKKRKHIFYSSMKNLYKELPLGLFFKCHKSYIVNINNLTERCKEDIAQGKEYITMSDGSRCLLSTRKINDLRRLISSVSAEQGNNKRNNIGALAKLGNLFDWIVD